VRKTLQVIIVAILSASGIAFARFRASQPTDDSRQIPITVQSNLVDLPVAVTDRTGHFVDYLSKENFRVLDNGKQREIVVFDHGDLPVTVGLVVDHSGSMGSKLTEVNAAAAAFARSSNQQDQLFVVNFNNVVLLTLPQSLAFTSDIRMLQTAIGSSDARGNTALYDAVIDSLDHLKLSTQERKALIIVTDGADNASQHNFQQMLATAMKSKAQIYCIGIYDQHDREAKPAELKRLAKITGGEAYFPRTVGEVSDISQKIANSLREQYTLGIMPATNARGNTWRSIRVVATAPGNTKLKVTTRSGYLFSGIS
jgi:Ca-activated chloride channel family protein